MLYNPFAFLVETWHFPHARTWRTSVTQKMLDTFLVFAGRFKPLKNPPKPEEKSVLLDPRQFDKHVHSMTLGLFDYLSLGLPLLLTQGVARLVNAIQRYRGQQKKKPTVSPLSLGLIDLAYYLSYGLFLFCNLMLNVFARLLFGVVGMFFVGLLITLPVAYLSMRYSRSIRKNAFNLEGSSTEGEELPFHEAFEPKNKSILLRDFMIQNATALSNGGVADQDCYQVKLVSSQDDDSQPHYYLRFQYEENTYLHYSEINKRNAKAIAGLLQINFAHAVDVLLAERTKNKHFAKHLKSVLGGYSIFKSIEAEPTTATVLNFPAKTAPANCS